ncbi:hypothetical protein [Pseudomonas soli]|uniref:hypothetical protein n=1 Tax=Pseudomonas soli TaxID=1306993 RepID=UPI003DA8ECAD
MPTKSRTSNKEMVSVPRELTQMAADAIDDLLADGVSAVSAAAWVDIPQKLRALLPKPAEQHQSEPVAPYPNRLCHIDYTAHPYRCGCLKGDEEAQRIYDEHRNAPRDEPSAKQAFRDYCDRCAEIVAPWPVWKREAIKSPPVPAVVCRGDAALGTACGRCIKCERIARENKPPVASDGDQSCDLATWKRRAIEAESKLRTYDPQVVELGERAMQALLAAPKPTQMVLTRCRLCDQLQADLTERDELIDRLRTIGARNVCHVNNGSCPDEVEGHTVRDNDCPACQALMDADVLLGKS